MSQVIDSLEMFDSWEDRYSYIIEIGNKLENFHESDKINENKVHGCVSNAWLILYQNNSKNIEFKAYSDSSIVRGLIYILIELLSNKSPEYIVDFDPYAIFKKIGFKDHLSPSRANGFFSMIQKIKFLSSKFSCKSL